MFYPRWYMDITVLVTTLRRVEFFITMPSTVTCRNYVGWWGYYDAMHGKDLAILQCSVFRLIATPACDRQWQTDGRTDGRNCHGYRALQH